jgi:seryl-tRNA synthetase
VADTQLDAQKRKEAQSRYDNINRRIEAVDRDISSETDGERLTTLREKRAGLAQDREAVSAELTALEKRTNGDLETLQRKVGELGRVLASDHPEHAHDIINECAAALARLDSRVMGLEGRVTAIERHIHPPWMVTFWRVCAVLAVVAGLTAAAVWPTVLFELYLPIGVIIEAAFVGLALVCILQANAQLERAR